MGANSIKKDVVVVMDVNRSKIEDGKAEERERERKKERI